MATPKKAPTIKVDKRSKEYRDAHKSIKKTPTIERVIAHISLTEATVPTVYGNMKELSYRERLIELEVHEESTLKLCNELLARIEKLESIVG